MNFTVYTGFSVFRLDSREGLLMWRNFIEFLKIQEKYDLNEDFALRSYMVCRIMRRVIQPVEL